jgi:hypothetical protein
MNKKVQLKLLLGFVSSLLFLALSVILKAMPTLVLQIASVTWNSGITS